jgi:uncharacterized protein (TIGR03067 family)
MKSVQGFMIASFGMSGYKQFEAGHNGVFIVVPSGRPNSWKHYRWYTPITGGHENYGNWSFLKDGATPGNGVVENWYELLESWFNVTEEQEAIASAQVTKKELDRLQGEWTMVFLEQRGRKVRDEIVKQFKLTIKGDLWADTAARGQETAQTRTVITIDPSEDPKTIDLTTKAGNDEFVLPGIYKLDGDTLTLCRAAAPGDVERPKGFRTTAEEGVLIVWKRAKK